MQCTALPAKNPSAVESKAKNYKFTITYEKDHLGTEISTMSTLDIRFVNVDLLSPQ